MWADFFSGVARSVLTGFRQEGFVGFLEGNVEYWSWLAIHCLRLSISRVLLISKTVEIEGFELELLRGKEGIVEECLEVGAVGPLLSNRFENRHSHRILRERGIEFSVVGRDLVHVNQAPKYAVERQACEGRLGKSLLESLTKPLENEAIHARKVRVLLREGFLSQ
jgi:hypothetical protein